MRHSILFVILSVSVGSACLGQGNSGNKDADAQWNDVVKLTNPAPSTALVKGTSTRSDVAKVQAEKAQSARAVEKAAKDFYSANPTHPNAVEAKKMEVIFALRGVTDEDKNHELAASSKATAFRGDTRNPIPDRFEVALMAERVNARTKLKGQLDSPNVGELEKIAAKLRTEFGDRPEVFNFYATIARSADMASARRIAVNLKQWPAGAAAKAEAESMLLRDALVGNPLPISLTTVDGQRIDLAQPNGKPTLLYFCSFGSGSTHSLASLHTFAKSLPPNTQVIYFVRGATVEEARSLRNLTPLSGVYCVEASNPTTLRDLQVRRMPFVFVLNTTGALGGFGPVAELGNLFAALGR